MNSGGGFFRYAQDVSGDVGEPGGIRWEASGENVENDFPFTRIASGGRWNSTCFFEFNSLMNQEGGIATIVQNHVRTAVSAIAPVENLLRTPPVLFEGFTLPGKHGGAFRAFWCSSTDYHGSGSVVLGGENVTASPANVCTQCDKSLNQNCGLNGHVEGSRNASALQRLMGTKFFTQGHQAWHFVLGKTKLVTTSFGERQIGNAVLEWGESKHRCILTSIQLCEPG
jgi:hypothetical protein